MLLAQGLGEYGMLVGQKGGAGGDSSAVRDIVQKVQAATTVNKDGPKAPGARSGGGAEQ